MDTQKFTVAPATAAGDLFLLAVSEQPCICYFGFVYVGYMIEDECGEVEVFERVPCRKCGEGS